MPETNVPKEVWEIESLRMTRMNALTQARTMLCERQRISKFNYEAKREHVVELAKFFEKWVLRD